MTHERRTAGRHRQETRQCDSHNAATVYLAQDFGHHLDWRTAAALSFVAVFSSGIGVEKNTDQNNNSVH